MAAPASLSRIRPSGGCSVPRRVCPRTLGSCWARTRPRSGTAVRQSARTSVLPRIAHQKATRSGPPSGNRPPEAQTVLASSSRSKVGTRSPSRTTRDRLSPVAETVGRRGSSPRARGDPPACPPVKRAGVTSHEVGRSADSAPSGQSGNARSQDFATSAPIGRTTYRRRLMTTSAPVPQLLTMD